MTGSQKYFERQTIGTVKYATQTPAKGSVPYTLRVSGIRGGHSGVDIHEKRGNALMILGNVLVSLYLKSEFELASLKGGDKRNAIPREAEATIFVLPEHVATIAWLVRTAEASAKKDFGQAEPGLVVSFSEVKESIAQSVLSEEGKTLLIGFFYIVPNGVRKMSDTAPGLVETFTDLAAVKHENGEFTIVTSQRSLVSTELEIVCDLVADILGKAKAKVKRAK